MIQDKKFLIKAFAFLMLVAAVQANAAGVNPFELAKNSFFELATSYVFLIMVAIIFVTAGITAYKTGELTALWWAAVAVVIIALIPTIAPGTIEFFRTFNPANTVSVTAP